MENARSSGSSGASEPAPVGALERALHAARALVLADLAAGGVAEAEMVSMVEESVTHRRWWVGQWPEGAGFVTGLVAQDVQDALFERYGRWPLCPVCRDMDPHALDVLPELGSDPHWVCSETGVTVAAVGGLSGTAGQESEGPDALGGSGGYGAVREDGADRTGGENGAGWENSAGAGDGADGADRGDGAGGTGEAGGPGGYGADGADGADGASGAGGTDGPFA